MKNKLMCPPLEGLRQLDDEALARLHTDCVEEVSNVEAQIAYIKSLGEVARPNILNVRDVFHRCIRNIRNVQAERRTDRSDLRKPYDVLYDAVKALLDCDASENDDDLWDDVEAAFNAVPTPNRYQQKVGAA